MEKDGAHLKFRRLPCAPGANGIPGSCFSESGIIELRDAWNMRHFDDPITSDNPMEIWRDLRIKLQNTCKNEKCWIIKLLGARRQETLIPRLFVPVANKKWCRNPREWLDSNDIAKVMHQYEDANDYFDFYGPAPIDFATMGKGSDAVWAEITEFDPWSALEDGQTCTGMVFNTDPHNKPGEHWISVFVDCRDSSYPYVAFSDSNGDPPPKELKSTIDQFKQRYNEGAGNAKNMIYKRNMISHQRKNTECGIYCLHMIISLLQRDYSLDEYFRERKPDKMMERLRTQFFYKEC